MHGLKGQLKILSKLLLMEFNYGECDCITPCSELYYRKTVYYTEMHNNFRQKTANLLKKFPDIALASVRISLPESQEYQVEPSFIQRNIILNNNFKHVEQADYAISQFLSDVGGSMGLILGVSLVSLLEVLECLCAGTKAGWNNRKSVRYKIRKDLRPKTLTKNTLTINKLFCLKIVNKVSNMHNIQILRPTMTMMMGIANNGKILISKIDSMKKNGARSNGGLKIKFQFLVECRKRKLRMRMIRAMVGLTLRKNAHLLIKLLLKKPLGEKS